LFFTSSCFVSGHIVHMVKRRKISCHRHSMIWNCFSNCLTPRLCWGKRVAI
jgi:hypothetical protein